MKEEEGRFEEELVLLASCRFTVFVSLCKTEGQILLRERRTHLNVDSSRLARKIRNVMCVLAIWCRSLCSL